MSEEIKRMEEAIRKLESEVDTLKSSPQRKERKQILKSIADLSRAIFSRNNLEIFLSLTSLVISTCIALYLAFFQ